jgi:Protein of unknown function (DUF3551)
MRIIALLVLTTVAVLKAAPAAAQTYGSEYPVCLQTYGDKGDYIECRYTSLAQCALSASGRSAECNINPYYRGPRQSPEGRDRRVRQRSHADTPILVDDVRVDASGRLTKAQRNRPPVDVPIRTF